VQYVATADGIHDGQINAEGLNGGVRPSEFGRHRMRLGTVSRGTETVDVHVKAGNCPQGRHEMLDMDSRAAVHLRWELSGQHPDSHGCRP
jgi:hypothetical protein